MAVPPNVVRRRIPVTRRSRPAPLGNGTRGDIQGLRAVAVLLVIAAHAHFALTAGGFVGVDVFFVLSGFLITGLLLRETDATGRLDIAGFYARRGRRILPAATVTMLAVLAYVSFTEPLTRVKSIAIDTLWASGFLANVHFAQIGTNYFGDHTPSPIQHYWSLAVEEQFYLVWPLLMLVALRGWRRRRALVATLLVVIGGSLAWSIWSTSAHPVPTYFSSPARAYELGIGAMLAVVAPIVQKARASLRGVVSLAGAGVLVATVLTMTEATPFPSWRALIPTLATAAIMTGGMGRPAGSAPLLSLQPLRYIGDISYSLYLWHWPVLRLGEEHLRGHLSAVPRTALLVGITFVLSILSYHFVEQPIRRGWRPLRGRRVLVLWPVSFALIGIGAWSAVGHSQHLFDQRAAAAAAFYKQHPTALAAPKPDHIHQDLARAVELAHQRAPYPPTLDLEKFKSDVWHSQYPCVAWWDQSRADICPVGDTTATRLVVLYGDSHAGTWLPALDVQGKTEHFKVIGLLKPGCGAFDIEEYSNLLPPGVCNAWRRWSEKQIATLHPDALVVGMRGYAPGTHASGGRTLPQTWSAGVASAEARFAELAPKVITLGDVPTRSSDPGGCVTSPTGNQGNCLDDDATIETSANPMTRVAALAAGSTYVDLVGLVCASGSCPLVVGSTMTYYDLDHITASWARIVQPAFSKLLGPLFPAAGAP